MQIIVFYIYVSIAFIINTENFYGNVMRHRAKYFTFDYIKFISYIGLDVLYILITLMQEQDPHPLLGYGTGETI